VVTKDPAEPGLGALTAGGDPMVGSQMTRRTPGIVVHMALPGRDPDLDRGRR